MPIIELDAIALDERNRISTFLEEYKKLCQKHLVVVKSDEGLIYLESADAEYVARNLADLEDETFNYRL